MRYPKEKSFWLLGLSGWILSLILITPAGFQSESGLFAVMLFAVWVLVGWGIALLPLPPGSRERKYPLIFPGAFLLSLAFTMERGTLAGLLSISWLLTLSWFVFGIIRKSGTLSQNIFTKRNLWNKRLLESPLSVCKTRDRKTMEGKCCRSVFIGGCSVGCFRSFWLAALKF